MKIEKEIRKVKRSKASVPFRLAHKIFESLGYHLSRTNGSHFMYQKEGEIPYSIPVHNNYVKSSYIHRFLKDKKL